MPVRKRTCARRARAVLAGLALAGACGWLEAGGGVAGASLGQRATVELHAVSVNGYGTVLANARDFTAYLLEKKGKPLACSSSACTAIWPPILVAKGSRLAGGRGVKGRIGLKAWRHDEEQLTYNGWPLYGYSGDTSAKQANGEGIASFGGTWYLLKAAATAADTTPVTATGSGGAGGW